MQRFISVTSTILLLAAVCCCLSAAKPPATSKVVYHSTKYGLTFSLANDWRGYSVLLQTWHGTFEAGDRGQVTAKEQGPIIVLRNPKWKAAAPCQDIPIYVFTHAQWEIHEKKDIAIHAGGLDYELAHNDRYVFAIYSRFDPDESVKGCQEADEIVSRNLAANHSPLYRK